MDTFFYIASFLVSSSHETFVKDNRRFFGGGTIAESVTANKMGGHSRG